MSKFQSYQQPQNYEDDEYIEQALADIPEEQDYDQEDPHMQMQQLAQMQQQMQPQQPQKPYNPYYDGIRSAIAEARQSFGASNEQQNRALRQSVLAFGKSIGGMERERGFKNNLLAAGRALAPAISTYDTQAAQDETSNQSLADQLLKHKWADEERTIRERDKVMAREDAERARQMQYEMAMGSRNEQARHHRALEDLKAQSIMERFNKAKEIRTENVNDELPLILNDAERVIREAGSSGNYGKLEQLGNKWLPGGFNKNQKQAEIDTIGDILRGKLFNAWGYRNQAEFEHVPSISSSNPPEVNLAIIKSLQNRFGNLNNLKTDELIEEVQPTEMGAARVMDPVTGKTFRIPIERVEEAINDGMELVE